MSREWAPPVRTDGCRITVVSDTHFGRRAFTTQAMTQAGTSLDRMNQFTDVFLDLGDCIHWNIAANQPAQDAAATTWKNARQAATSKPWATIGGNHDLQSYGTPYPNRSGDQWATDMTLDARNHVHDHADWLRLITITPTYQGYDASIPGHLPMELNTDEIAWIKAKADAAPYRQVMLFFHAPIPAHYTGHMQAESAQNIQAMIADTPNITAWVSGHRHTNLLTDTNCVRNITVGSRTIHAVNVPAFGGATPGYTDDRWGQPFQSTHLHVFEDGHIDVRFRDHMQNRWVRWAKTGQFVNTLEAIA